DQVFVGQYYCIIPDYTIFANMDTLRVHEVRHGTECERYVITELHAERFPVQHMLDFCRRSISPEFDEYEVVDNFDHRHAPAPIPPRLDLPRSSSRARSPRYPPVLRCTFFP